MTLQQDCATQYRIVALTEAIIQNAVGLARSHVSEGADPKRASLLDIELNQRARVEEISRHLLWKSTREEEKLYEENL